MKDNTKVYSSKQEHLVADVLGWEVVAGSGAAACFPGDIKSDEWLGECKTHTSPNHRILFKKDVWNKICSESTFARRNPVLVVDDGSQRKDRTWCLFLRNCLRTPEVTFVDISKYCRVNISFSHECMEKSSKGCKIAYPGKLVMFETSWNGQDVLVCKLEDFAEAIQ